jgi:DNA-binding MarR family transcriptional regulator
MNPHQLEALSAGELSAEFRSALSARNVPRALDAFTQLESRFQRLTATIEGSQKFLDQFLLLGGSPEVRALHMDDACARCANRMEYLLELAGEHARSQTIETTLRQIVATRERGHDLLKALSLAPKQGLTAGQLAQKLRVKPSNLSPLIGKFSVHGIIDRSEQGKHSFLKLTPQGRALLEPVEVEENGNGTAVEREFAFNTGIEENQGEIFLEAMRQAVHDVRNTPFQSKKGILGAAEHGLRRVEEQYKLSNPVAAAALGNLRNELRQAISIASVAA